MQNESDSRITFRYLSEPDMVKAGVTDMAKCIDSMERVFRLLGVGDYRMAGPGNNSHGAWVMFPDDSPFPRMPKNADERRFMAMPAYLGGEYHLAGMKWYGSNMENKSAGLPRSVLVFVLNDADTGAPKAIMSANLLSAYRTGAVPGVGARYFARPDSRVLGIVGPGVMNRTSLAAFMVECPEIDTVKILGRSESGIQKFRDHIAEKYPTITNVTVVDTIEEAVRDSDIVSVAATAPAGSAHYPLVKREWVKPGAFLSLPASVNIDDALLEDDVLKVVDNRGLYEAWASETPAPHHELIGIIGAYFMDLIETGRLEYDDIVDFGKIVAGQAKGRTDDDQIVLFSVGGMPVEDIAWGADVYKNAVAQGIGTDLLLWDTPALT